MDLRVATSEDVKTLIRIDHVARINPERSAFIAKAVADGSCLVAVVDGDVVGYGVLEYSFFGNGFISMLYVDEEKRRTGIGSILLTALMHRCGTAKLFTSTNQSNRAMQSLLLIQGFKPSGIIHNLDAGDPELVYFKSQKNGAA